MRSKSNNQIDLDLDRFVGRDQSDQTKKNVFDTAAKTEKYATLQNQFKMHAMKYRTKLVAFDNKNGAKNYTCYIFYFKKLLFICLAADGRGIDRLRHM